MAKEENLFDNTAADSGKPSANTEKLKALRAAMDKIEKKYGVTKDLFGVLWAEVNCGL